MRPRLDTAEFQSRLHVRGRRTIIPKEKKMDWARIYQDTVRHMLPQTQPYADLLRDFVLAERIPIATWIREAEAMLHGFGPTLDPEDLSMLAAMIERGSLAMLPAVGIGDLVARAIAANRRDLAIMATSHGHLMAMLPLEDDNADRLARLIAARIVKDVVCAVDWLGQAARNAAAQPGERTDLTGHAQRMRMEPVWIMATSLVMPVIPFDRISPEMASRLAA